MTIDDCIRPYMARLGWSKGELAKRRGITQAGLYKTLLKRPEDVQPRTLHKLAEALGVSTDIFFEKTVGEQTHTDRAPRCAGGALPPPGRDDQGAGRGIGRPEARDASRGSQGASGEEGKT